MKRLDLKVGFLCNNFCRFCVQGNKRSQFGEKPLARVQSELKKGFEDGLRSLVLTGGEPTVHKNFLEVVKAAKETGYEIIQIQSNGRTFSDEKFLDALIDAGATEFGPALHGHKAAIHDYLTRVPGSWKQTVKGMLNIKDRGYPVAANGVVTKPNYRYLSQLGALFVKLGVSQYQFAFVHALGQADSNFDSIVPRVSLAAPYIHKGLDVGIAAGLLVMVEAMPFCLMKGYEKCVSEFYIPEAAVFDANSYLEDFNKWREKEGKVKFEKCKNCKYFKICEGPWREYPEKRGDSEFVPVPGEYVNKKNIFGE